MARPRSHHRTDADQGAAFRNARTHSTDIAALATRPRIVSCARQMGLRRTRFVPRECTTRAINLRKIPHGMRELGRTFWLSAYECPPLLSVALHAVPCAGEAPPTCERRLGMFGTGDYGAAPAPEGVGERLFQVKRRLPLEHTGMASSSV